MRKMVFVDESGKIHRFCTGKKDYDILFSLIERKIKVMEELK